MSELERLRLQLRKDVPSIDLPSRLYEDELYLLPAEAAAAPVEHLTPLRLRTALDAAPHLVALAGHGSPDGCCGLDTTMAATLTNGYQSFIAFADSCLTAQFNVEDAASERLLSSGGGGAVAFVGLTNLGWLGVDEHFQRAFFGGLVSTRHLGLLADTRCTMVNEVTGGYRLYNKWVIFALNLLGDPEMPIWAGRPLEFAVDFSAAIDKREPLRVHVLRADSKLAIPGAVVHMRAGPVTRIIETDESGAASFELSSAPLGPAELTVTAEGYIPFLGTSRITGPASV